MKSAITRRANARRAVSRGSNRGLVILVGLVGLTALAFLLIPRSASVQQVDHPAEAAIPLPSDVESPAATNHVALVAPPSVPPLSKPAPAKPVAPVSPPVAAILPRGEPTAEARAAVAVLAQLDVSSGNITPTQAAVWKESLRALVGQGETAVPAIREFLEKNLDLNFGSLDNGAAMGASSLRMALLKAMQEIGGEQAIAGSLQTLQTSADPTELALVAGYLQKADPAQYRDSVLAAAHEALNMAATGEWDGRDVAPLFDVLKTFGGELAAQDLERYANKWFNYTPLVLAELPEGAGIPSLIRLATDGSVTLGKETYQRMLAQVSAQSPDAATALVQLAQAGKIDPSSWRAMADALTGITLQLMQTPVSSSAAVTASSKTYHVALGNQNYLEQPAPAEMPADQVTQRIALIDQLLGVTSNPSAVSYLQAARTQLASRQ